MAAYTAITYLPPAGKGIAVGAAVPFMAVTREETEAQRAERERKELEAERDREARRDREVRYSYFGFLIGLLEGRKKPGKP